MKNLILITLFSFLVIFPTFGQQNMNLLSNFTYTQDVSDIWGYAANGREYALVGVRNGVSIVDVTDAANPVESDFIAGPSSTWRDLKAYNGYAYITNETSGGLLVIDLSTLPGTVTSQYYQPVVGTPMESAHNLYIDEFGFIYVVGANENNGGAIILDANQDAWNPPVVALGPSVYAHDIYVRDNVMYNSEIYAGIFTAYDVSDKTNITFQGSQSTPFTFTHNAWLSDDGKSIFTTDETGDAPIGAYDISNITNIQKLDEFRPPATVNKGVIPHNVHVLNDFLVISYYTDGVVIVDANRPQTLVQVGQYRTWQGGSGGFDGCWGAYPFLPSGNVLATDISNGLFVLGANYVRACYLEGKITDSSNGNEIPTANITIVGPGIGATTDNSGDYASGLSDAGTYSVMISKAGFATKTVPGVVLTNGQVTQLDVQLDPLTPFQFVGTVLDFDTGDPIPNAKVNISNANYDFDLVTDAAGAFSVNSLYSDTYRVYAGIWGHITAEKLNQTISGPTTYTITLRKGYEDVFQLDLGWTIFGDASRGIWERGEPIGTSFQGNESNPENDVTSDVGDFAYVTGNGGGNAGTDDVDGGTTILLSPIFDVSAMTSPAISFHKWFFNAGGNGTPNDNLVFRLSNGSTSVALDSVDYNTQGWSVFTLPITPYITPTATMRLSVECADIPGGHITEGAIDFFRAFDLASTPNINIEEKQFNLAVSPNPTKDQFTVDFELDAKITKATLVVTNVVGQVLETIEVSNNTNQIQFGAQLTAGLYFVQIISSDSKSQPVKVIKVN